MGRLSLGKISKLYTERRWTMQRIADKFGVSRQAVHERLKRAGVETRRSGPTPAKFPEAVLRRLYEKEGLSISKVAERLNSTPGKIGYAMRWHKIPGRRGSEWRRKYPELARLAIGEHLDLPKNDRRQPHGVFYKMAKRQGIRVSTRSIDENTMRVTRKA